jgi:hypothetical protein
MTTRLRRAVRFDEIEPNFEWLDQTAESLDIPKAALIDCALSYLRDSGDSVYIHEYVQELRQKDS